MRYLIPLILITFMSCAAFKKKAKDEATTGNGNLNGTSWVIQYIAGFDLEQTERKASLSFSDTSTRYGGYSGCNMFGGEFELKGKSLHFSNALSTKRACMPGMKTENAVFRMLEATNSYSLEGDKLLLKKDETVLAELVKEEMK